MLAIEIYLQNKKIKENFRNTMNVSEDKIKFSEQTENEIINNKKGEILINSISGDNFKITNKKMISLFNYKLNKKLGVIYYFFLHFISILAIGYLSKYALSEDIIEYDY